MKERRHTLACACWPPEGVGLVRSSFKGCSRCTPFETAAFAADSDLPAFDARAVRFDSRVSDAASCDAEATLRLALRARSLPASALVACRCT